MLREGSFYRPGCSKCGSTVCMGWEAVSIQSVLKSPEENLPAKEEVSLEVVICVGPGHTKAAVASANPCLAPPNAPLVTLQGSLQPSARALCLRPADQGQSIDPRPVSSCRKYKWGESW